LHKDPRARHRRRPHHGLTGEGRTDTAGIWRGLAVLPCSLFCGGERATVL